MQNSKLMQCLIALVLVLGLASPALAGNDPKPEGPAHSATLDATKAALRELWVEHVFWIRNYVVANEAGDAEALEVAETQVVANAKAIAEAIKPFYGQEASDALLKLLASHWGAVKGYADAIRDEDRADADAAVEELTANAREIAQFLSGANPYLAEDALFSLLSVHGSHHVSQVDQIHVEDYAAEAKTWHAMRKHMFVIADALAEALASQFPDKF